MWNDAQSEERMGHYFKSESTFEKAVYNSSSKKKRKDITQRLLEKNRIGHMRKVKMRKINNNYMSHEELEIQKCSHKPILCQKSRSIVKRLNISTSKMKSGIFQANNSILGKRVNSITLSYS